MAELAAFSLGTGLRRANVTGLQWSQVELVVADAGPLIAFGRIQILELLPQVLGEVLVPHAVTVECLVDSIPSAASLPLPTRTNAWQSPSRAPANPWPICCSVSTAIEDAYENQIYIDEVNLPPAS